MYDCNPYLLSLKLISVIFLSILRPYSRLYYLIAMHYLIFDFIWFIDNYRLSGYLIQKKKKKKRNETMYCCSVNMKK